MSEKIEAVWRVERTLYGRTHSICARTGVPGRVDMVYVNANGATVTFTLEEMMFLHSAMSALVTEQGMLDLLSGLDRAHYGEPPANRTHRAGEDWTADEETTAIRMWEAKLPVNHIAEEIGRSEIAIAAKLNQKGVAKTEEIMATSTRAQAAAE